MSQSQEKRYYKFLSRDEALAPTQIDRLGIAPEHKHLLREAHRRMVPYLSVITVEHLDYDGNLKEGQLVVHRDLADNIQGRFKYLHESGFRIEKVMPQVLYKDDAASMAHNNTSGQRSDFIGAPERGVLSKHLVGAAVDIEPVHNKMQNSDGTVEPPYTEDYVERPESMFMRGKDIREDIIGEFSRNGFEYGGLWPDPNAEEITGHPDYYPGAPADKHHFELRDKKLDTETQLMDMRDLELPQGIIFEPDTGRVRAAF